MRRLPVYLLLDCSESMIGDSIESVYNGLDMLIGTLRRDPQALETAWVSVLAFHEDAEQLVPLTELVDFQLPSLPLRPGTALGKGLQLLAKCLQREVRQTTPDRKGDYRPLVFLLTDGLSTDSHRAIKSAAKKLQKACSATIYAIGCGDDVDFSTLNEISDMAFKMIDMQPSTMEKLFTWLSASVQGASVTAGLQADYQGIDLEKKPAEVDAVAPGTEEKYRGKPPQVFFKVYCLDKKLPYLLRYRLNQEVQRYEPVRAHRLEVDAKSAKGFKSANIPFPELLGSLPACPYCENGNVAQCNGCQTTMCLPLVSPPPFVVCPVCGVKAQLVDGNVSMGQSAG